MSPMRRLALVALLWAAIGCDPSASAPRVEQPAVEAKSVVESTDDFRKFVQGQIARLNAIGFTTSDKFQCDVRKIDSPVTRILGVLNIDAVRKGNAEGPHEVLNQAQRAKDSRAIAAYRRTHGNPLATPELPPQKYTLPEIAARTVFVLHLEVKYRPQNGTWVLARGNAQVVRSKGLEDKNIALDAFVTGQRYIFWRLEDLERLF